MGVIILATLLSLLAFFTGIFAVGSGSRWQYKRKDILKGRKNAVLYVWITFSSMFSAAHTAACGQYLLTPIWGTGPEIQMWFALHALIGVLLSVAHLLIHRIMKVDGASEAYLWGNKP